MMVLKVMVCPFCGAAPFMKTVDDSGGAQVICTACGSVGPLGVNVGDAVEKWNLGDLKSRKAVDA